MPALDFTVTGTEKLQQALTDLAQRATPALAAALSQEAETIMTTSKQSFVPVDLGVLRDSGFVQAPDVSGSSVSVTMGFGGAAEAYALVQHERLDYHHTTGGPKYLERPFLMAAKGLVDRIADRLRAAWVR